MQQYIEHHGVPGQRWGVRNGPPYPLNAEGMRSFKEHLNQGRIERRAKKIEKRVTKAGQKVQKKLEKKEAAENSKLEKRVRLALSGKISIDKLSAKEMEAYVNHMKKRVEIMELTLKSDQKMKDIRENDKSAGRKIVEAQMSDIGKRVVIPLITGIVGYELYKAFNKHAAKKAPSTIDMDKAINDAINKGLKDLKLDNATPETRSVIEQALRKVANEVANNKEASRNAEAAQRAIEEGLKQIFQYTKPKK